MRWDLTFTWFDLEHREVVEFELRTYVSVVEELESLGFAEADVEFVDLYCDMGLGGLECDGDEVC